jgi:phenylalanyl-tRNA synthetase beta chain
MLIARSWLQDYIDISDLSDKVLAATLVDLGLEVEKISVQAGLDHQIVVGEVLEIVPHPNADSLNHQRCTRQYPASHRLWC